MCVTKLGTRSGSVTMQWYAWSFRQIEGVLLHSYIQQLEGLFLLSDIFRNTHHWNVFITYGSGCNWGSILLLISNPTAESSRDGPSSNHVNLCVSVVLGGWRGEEDHRSLIYSLSLTRPSRGQQRKQSDPSLPLWSHAVRLHKLVWTLTQSK